MKKDSWFFDKNFNGVPDDVLDNVGEFFDFQLEDVETDGVMEEDWNAQFNNLEEPSLGVFPILSPMLFGQTQNENPQLRGTFPASVIKQVTKTAGPTYGKMIPIKNISLNGTELHQFKSYSPVSVFDVPVIPAKRPRGKRRRRSNFSKLSIPFGATSTAIQKNRRTANSKSDLERQPAGKSVSRRKGKQTKKDLSLPSDRAKKTSSSQALVVSRKCTHCEMTETPQWRLGPMGPKTLCNACGVRYRSGRLFPEYRPAASPTFVASLHSNSHKKVLEMRSNANWETIEGSTVYYLPSNQPGNSLV